MRRSAVVAAAGLTAAASPALADDDAPVSQLVRVASAPESVAGVNALLVPPSDVTDSPIAAALTAVPSGSQFRATVAPFQAFDTKYREVLSESKLSAVFDSKANLFTLGVSLAYNPFSLRGRRVGDIIDSVTSADACGGAYTAASGDLYAALERQHDADKEVKRLQASRGSAVDLAAANAKLAEATKAVDDINARTLPPYHACQAKRLADEWPHIFGSWFPYVSASVAVGLFPTGRTADPLNAMLTAPLEPWGGVSTNLDLQFRPCLYAAIEIWGSYKNTRPTGAPRTQLSDSLGAGATASYLGLRFLSGKKLVDNDDYKTSGFVPGMALGASFQYQHCYGGVYCDSGKIDDQSVTPFIDVRAKQSLQFRLSFPIEWSRSVMVSTGTSVAPTITIGGAIGGL